MKRSLLSTAVLLCAFATVAPAQIQEIEPFKGEHTEDFESFGLTFETQLDLFGGEAVLSGTTGVLAVFVVPGSSIGGSPSVSPHTGGWFGGGGEPVNWIFDTPVHQFGGYFATNSGASDAIADFFDPNDNLIDSRVVSVPNDQSWHWNGWTSTLPIKRIAITGNGSNQGFVDYDDMQLSHASPEVPTMSQWAIVSMAVLFLTAITIKFSRLRPVVA